ncbi:hypothetical protein AAFF_G00351890 [Aldrovandia affinis]|uniref:Integrase catalytic domain-containing protein n=1 Tax=Aldrovandia affinis TaxID=143900 RepID=A0AAD7SJT9_9TELE|nr:hypothetical protein AAFF_G00351890 [Aldrovandia affinis]
MAKAFVDPKQALANVTMLVHLFSDRRIGLCRRRGPQPAGGVWHPLAFFNRQLRPNEQKYSMLDRKLFGFYLAVHHFRFLLEGRPFTAFVDHKPLAKIAEPWSAHQQCHTPTCLQNGHVKVPEKQFDHINVDLVGPLPTSRGFTYLLTMVDRTTRWPEAIQLASTTTADVAQVFIGTWVARFGAPLDPFSGRGPQFTSELRSEVAQSLSVTLHCTTAYHPQANDLCEHFHRSTKAALRASLKDDSRCDRLPWVLLGIRTAPERRSSLFICGSERRLLGQCPLPGMAYPSPGSQAPFAWRSLFSSGTVHTDPLQPPYNGPFHNRVIKLSGVKPDHVSVDRLKPAHQDLGHPVGLGRPPPDCQAFGALTCSCPGSLEPVRMCDPGS